MEVTTTTPGIPELHTTSSRQASRPPSGGHIIVGRCGQLRRMIP
jgi:hypothetical protein